MENSALAWGKFPVFPDILEATWNIWYLHEIVSAIQTPRYLMQFFSSKVYSEPSLSGNLTMMY